MSSPRQGVSHKRHQDVKLFKPKGRAKFFSRKENKNKKPNKPYFVTCEYSRAVFTKRLTDTLTHALVNTETAASKDAPNIVTAAASQNRGSPLVCLALLPLPPQSEDGTPNNTIEYANYLHVNTPRKTKSTAQTLYKDRGQGSKDPNPFRQLDVALRGARVRRMMEMILK